MSTEQQPEEKPVLMSEEEQERVRRYLRVERGGGTPFTEEEIEQSVRIVRTMSKTANLVQVEDALFLVYIDRACKRLTEEKKDG